jgi:hypothetical protein
MLKFILKLRNKFKTHDFIVVGKIKAYHQKSDLIECKKCGVMGFAPPGYDLKEWNTSGCSGTYKRNMFFDEFRFKGNINDSSSCILE